MSQKNLKNDNIEITYSDLIDETAEKFGSHDGVTRGRISKWLQQFEADAQQVAAKLLKEILYFTSTNIRSMVKDLVHMAFEEFPDIPKSRVFYVPIGGAGSGSHMLARLIKGMAEISNRNVVDLIDLGRIDPQNIELIIFIDDFSGTGNTIKEWWQRIEPLVLPIDAISVVGILVLNYRAEKNLDSVFSCVLPIQMLDESYNVFDNKCNRFSDNEKRVILAACEATNCGSNYVKGYGECGLLVAFRHGCPNNSLPILWYDRHEWVNLFKRRNA